jgi:hypothetical protein
MCCAGVGGGVCVAAVEAGGGAVVRAELDGRDEALEPDPEHPAAASRRSAATIGRDRPLCPGMHATEAWWQTRIGERCRTADLR